MKIGNIDIPNNVFLAPMAGITDLSFRLLCKRQDCGMVYTEMVSAKGLYYNSRRTYDLLRIDPEERPIAVQIFGSEPKVMGEMAEKLSATDADIIDINMGCPAPKIVKNNEGAALMRDPKKVGQIVRAVVSASSKPVTVKMRMGWDESSINVLDIAKIVEDAGAEAITVHGRTRDQFYRGQANWDIIARVKEAVGIPVIGNGDIWIPEDGKRMLDHTGCDAVMIGRGAQGNPWIFKRTVHYLRTGELLPETTSREKVLMALLHLDMAVAFKGEDIAVPEMRKHISWYLKGIQGSANMRAMINTMRDAEAIKETLHSYLKDV